jgi:tetratricopeptide (TPR) repeat protein
MRAGIAICLFLFEIMVAHSATSPIRIFLVENRLDDAVPLCRQIEVLKTNDPDDLFACTWVYFRTDRMDSAEKLLKQLKGRSSNVEYQLLIAFSKMKKKQYEEAKAMLSKITQDNKGTPTAMAAQELYGELYEAMGQLDTAAFVYKQLVDDDPTRARAHWGLGRYYLGRGDLHRAQTHLEKVAQLWPRHLGSRYNLAIAALNGGDLQEAAKWLVECAQLDRLDPGVLEQLGVLYEKRGMISKALQFWQRALEIKKDSPVAKEKLVLYTSNIIDALVAAKQYDKALAQLKAMGSVVSDQPKLLLRRGQIYSKMGKWDKASADLRQLLNSTPNDPAALRELGICYVNLRLVDQAGGYFARAITLEPDNGLNHAWIAFVLESKGELERARDEWRRATELLKDRAELEKANRRLTSLEKKLNKIEREKEKQIKEKEKDSKEKEDE